MRPDNAGNRTNAIAAFLLLLWIVPITRHAVSQEQQLPKQADLHRKTSAPHGSVRSTDCELGRRQMLQEIREIRQRVGIDLYQGTSLQCEEPLGIAADDGEFQEALENVTVRSSSSPNAVGPPGHESGHELDPTENRCLSVDHRFVSALRDAGRLLDDQANLLESFRQYDRADKLRRLAQRLRREARQTEAAEKPVQRR